MESPCFILPHGESRSRAYVCLPVEDSTVGCSSVLETLIEAGGTSQLPDGISVTDFLSWSWLQGSSFHSLSMEDLARVLNVRFHIFPFCALVMLMMHLIPRRVNS